MIISACTLHALGGVVRTRAEQHQTSAVVA